MITDFVTTAAFHYVFVVTVLRVISQVLPAAEAVSKTSASNCYSPFNDICLSFMKTCVPRVPKLHICTRVAALQMLSLQQEIRPYVNGFPLVCCDHSTLSQ